MTPNKPRTFWLANTHHFKDTNLVEIEMSEHVFLASSLEPKFETPHEMIKVIEHDAYDSCVEMLKDIIRNSRCVVTKKMCSNFLVKLGELESDNM